MRKKNRESLEAVTHTHTHTFNLWKRKQSNGGIRLLDSSILAKGEKKAKHSKENKKIV